MTSAYVTQLRRQLDAEQADSPPAKPDLRQRFVEWHASLPEISRNRPFSMAEMEAALDTQGKYLSQVLLGLGWQRKRRWTGGGRYNRYWLPSGEVPKAHRY